MVQPRGTIFQVTSRTAGREVRVPDPLPELLREANEPLYVIKTVFPFVLFTDKIIIRANHVDVIHGLFFWSAISTRIQVPDIRQVSIQFNPIFATLEIIPQGPLEQTLQITFSWKRQAKKARRILAGLMESHQKEVDFSKYTNGSLVRAMEQLGTATE